jgi:hypothetical protein
LLSQQYIASQNILEFELWGLDYVPTHLVIREFCIHSDSSGDDVNAEVSGEAVTPCDGGEQKDNMMVPSGLDEMSTSTTLPQPGKDGSKLNVEASFKRPMPVPVPSSSPPRNILLHVANDATSLHAIKQRRVQKRLVCDVSWGKSSRVENSVKLARATLRPTEVNPLHPEIFRSNTRNACSKHQLSQPNSCYEWHDTNARFLWCELSK